MIHLTRRTHLLQAPFPPSECAKIDVAKRANPDMVPKTSLCEQAHRLYRSGIAAGGVSTSGGAGLGFGGRTAAPGAGRTSIGGGKGAAC